MSITATAQELNKMQLAIFYEFCQEHPDVVQTAANGRALRSYLDEHGLSVSWKSLTSAYTALKAAGQLELKKSQAQIAEEQNERIRREIYRQVSEKLAPGKIDFSNKAVLNKIAAFLHAKENGLCSVDRVLRAIEFHKFDEGFWAVEPPSLYKPSDYVDGKFNHSKREFAEEPSEPLSRRRNHAADFQSRESEESTKKVQSKLKDDEARAIGMLWEQAIDSYRAVVNGRISWSKTETIQNLLRKTKKILSSF